MNSSTYIFGELSNGYSQYPEDSSSNLFSDIKNHCVSPSQLIIHRDDSMMYYIYVRKIDKNKYIGFAIAINGYYLIQIQPLFSLFENEIENMVESGVIINLSNDGEITSNLPSLRNEEEEVMSIVNSLQVKANDLKNLKKLPPVDFSVSISSRKIFKDTDSASEIVDASYRFGFTIVLKESDYDTVRTTNFRNIVKNLNAEKIALINENEELKEQNKIIQRQKKQFKKVVFLVLILLACGVGIFFLNENLNTTKDQLDMANYTISEKESIIVNKDYTISDLSDSVNSLKYRLNREIRAKERVEDYLQSICTLAPFAVTNCEVNANEFKFDYFCPEETEITVTLKAINERNCVIISDNYTLTFFKGTGSKSLDFYRKLDSSEYYYVVLMYHGHIVAGKRW